MSHSYSLDEIAGLIQAQGGQQVFTTSEAAEYLRVSSKLLELYRVQGGGPRFAKISRLVRYRRAALDAWLAEHERTHTSV